MPKPFSLIKASLKVMDSILDRYVPSQDAEIDQIGDDYRGGIKQSILDIEEAINQSPVFGKDEIEFFW